MKKCGSFVGTGGMAVRAAAALVLAGLALGLLPPAGGGSGSGAAAPPEAPVKDGYTLAPEVYSAFGVYPGGAFILTVPKDTTAQAVSGAFTIDGEPAPTVTSRGAREFLIEPAARLFGDSLYTFRLQKPDGGEVTWVFQTAGEFNIASVLPAHQSTNVPVDTGIEITFSERDFEPIDKLFEISPAVAGRFEYHKETAVFVPNKLEYATVYTVTLKSGARRAGGGEAISGDTVFSFETQPAPGDDDPARDVYISFNTQYAELPPSRPPVVGMYAYSYKDKTAPSPDAAVYKFSGASDAVAAVEKLLVYPLWANYARAGGAADTSRLERVMELDSRAYDAQSGTLTFPGALGQGFYLVEAACGDARAQMVVQISDLPVQVISDSARALVWVNDMTTGKAAAGAVIKDAATGKSYTADKSGVAEVGRALDGSGSQALERLDISYGAGRQCVWLYTPGYSVYHGGPMRWRGDGGDEGYWSTTRLDRTLFARGDTVSFWGFVKNRDSGVSPGAVTIALTQGYNGLRYSAGSGRDILHRTTVRVAHGAYSGAFDLPMLDPGSYCLSVMDGEATVSAVYFSVEDFVKPDYVLQASPDKKAVFLGDYITFETKASFFEGTPVAELGVSYGLYGYPLRTLEGGSGTTDRDGAVAVAQRAETDPGVADAQGVATVWFNAEATLPETGPTYASASALVFINDMDASAGATRDGADAKLTVEVRAMTPERINNGTAEHVYDYLGGPISGKDVTADIYRVYWTREDTGETYYDYIEKKSVTRWRYVRNEEKISAFTVTTGDDGVAEHTFTVPNRKDECYFAKIACTDGNGRRISHEVYIGEDYTDRFWRINSNDYSLEGARESYNTGDEVNLSLTRAGNVVSSGGFLYVTEQRGITDWAAGKSGISFTFGAAHIPNVTVCAYYFDGNSYHSSYNMRAYIRFNYEANSLGLKVDTDKETYRPGETCVVTVTSSAPGGMPVAANINVSAVDEALFALRDYSSDTAAEIYRSLGDGITAQYATHATAGQSAVYFSASVSDADEGAAPMAAPEAKAGAGDGGAGGGYLRERFEDTAFFDSARSGADGKAIFTIKLPDNVTSWRLSVSGVSDALFAGSRDVGIKVTQPMFINCALGDEFLTGDAPVLGVNVYGSGLTGGESVTFEVTEQGGALGETLKVSGAAPFERVDIPLWSLSRAGDYSLIVKASVEGGQTDSLRRDISVYESYRRVDTARYYDAAPGAAFDVGAGGLTSITFSDRGRGQYLSELLNLRYVCGDRVEKRVASREAGRLIAEYFPELEILPDTAFEPARYQKGDGGMAPLPYAESDAWLTSMLLPYIAEDVNRRSLADYLYGEHERAGAAGAVALYGLAQLGQPVLPELEALAGAENLKARDAVYAALSYAALGERARAEELYDSFVAPQLEVLAPYYRVNTGEDNDDILRATSAASLLASRLGKPEKDGLYAYCTGNFADDVLISLEKLSFISGEIARADGGAASVTYKLYGQEYTRDLSSGGSYTLRIPAARIGELELTGTAGRVGAVSVVSVPLAQSPLARPDSGITVKRAYYSASGGESKTTFESGELVRVNLWIDYTGKAIDGSYSVTDYLPSGLEYASNSAKLSGEPGFGYAYHCYAQANGREVTFYDYNGRFDKGRLYYYFARVINPGGFRAEGTLVQSLSSASLYTLGEDTQLTINS
ncbi:MAG: Ig-like domain-containing protein [Oscillospiraceae bacterium]|jgi:uncharacterized protein YfaS (alpha-2-macroglobulin family)|nr:Ig-like domain-containing protein [Oscillospiraceae bacterium]